jgi:hypothetical protein
VIKINYKIFVVIKYEIFVVNETNANKGKLLENLEKENKRNPLFALVSFTTNISYFITTNIFVVYFYYHKYFCSLLFLLPQIFL